jgi:hypothetical protein
MLLNRTDVGWAAPCPPIHHDFPRGHGVPTLPFFRKGCRPHPASPLLQGEGQGEDGGRCQQRSQRQIPPVPSSQRGGRASAGAAGTGRAGVAPDSGTQAPAWEPKTDKSSSFVSVAKAGLFQFRRQTTESQPISRVGTGCPPFGSSRRVPSVPASPLLQGEGQGEDGGVGRSDPRVKSPLSPLRKGGDVPPALPLVATTSRNAGC